MAEKIMNFLRDDDGFSARDYIMVVFTSVFIIFLVTAFILSIVGTVSPATIQIIQSMDGVIMTIVGGVFGVQGVREFVNYRQNRMMNYTPPVYDDVPVVSPSNQATPPTLP